MKSGKLIELLGKMMTTNGYSPHIEVALIALENVVESSTSEATLCKGKEYIFYYKEDSKLNDTRGIDIVKTWDISRDGNSGKLTAVIICISIVSELIKLTDHMRRLIEKEVTGWRAIDEMADEILRLDIDLMEYDLTK